MCTPNDGLNAQKENLLTPSFDGQCCSDIVFVCWRWCCWWWFGLVPMPSTSLSFVFRLSISVYVDARCEWMADWLEAWRAYRARAQRRQYVAPSLDGWCSEWACIDTIIVGTWTNICCIGWFGYSANIRDWWKKQRQSRYIYAWAWPYIMIHEYIHVAKGFNFNSWQYCDIMYIRVYQL